VAGDSKLACRKQAWIIFEDESGASLTPAVRRTWSPRGKTPVLRHPFNWKRISMAAALAYRWDGARTRLYFQTWDGLPLHRGGMMTEFLAKQRHWLDVRRLPAYAPELNPVEGLWSNLKSQELANRCESHVQMVTIAARQGADRLRPQRSLLLGFLRHTGLRL
jgi:hypothetical protein